MKLVRKWREGARWRRRHDVAQTAYQRLLKMGKLPAKKRRQWREEYESLDPFALHDQLERGWRPILKSRNLAKSDLTISRLWRTKRRTPKKRKGSESNARAPTFSFSKVLTTGNI